MTFEEHLENHRNDDGSYDLDAAEAARAQEIRDSFDDEQIDKLAAKAAKKERSDWANKETEHFRKQVLQPALSAALELRTKVQLGDSIAVNYGDMDHKRIRLRRDLRTKIHRDEFRAYDAEMNHWDQTEPLLDDGETIADAMGRQS